MALLKYGTVEEHINRDSHVHVWNVHLCCAVNDWEMLAISCLLLRLENTSMGNILEPDQQLWSLSPSSK